MVERNMTTLEALRAARDLIADPARWTTNFAARSKHGRSVSARSKAACQWCALGALEKVARSSEAAILAQRRLKVTALYFHNDYPATVNDRLGHAAVMAMFDEAIRAEEAAADA